ncbi:MAG: hypothetical protein PHI12_11045 [Dehalococcoidales bacterium]|nr:hypothetical protein [Dehalococcoidales bacterium]
MNDTQTAREAFREAYGGQLNLMTPDVIELGLIAPGVAYEISEGEGIDGGPLYGFTVAIHYGGRWLPSWRVADIVRQDLSRPFHDMSTLREYLDTLRRQHRERR